MTDTQELHVIKPRIKGFICTTAHPLGCKKNVLAQIEYAEKHVKPIQKYKKVLILGASAGFGLAARIALAVGGQASTLGVYLERGARGKRTGSPGYYNSKAFSDYCVEKGIYHRDFNADGFSNATREEVAKVIREDLGQIDLLLYSLAAPRRTHPDTGETFSSVLKPIGQPYSSKTMDLVSGKIQDVSIDPANEDEVAQTVAVMGGDDWKRWITFLQQEGLLAQGFESVAFSYIGSELTYPIYKDGTIGAAKKDLEATTPELNKLLEPLGGKAVVSVNKALVTQASSAIPVVPLYLSLLYKVMKEEGVHETCIEQMVRLFNDRLSNDRIESDVDAQGRIRIDDWELRDDIQKKVLDLWKQVTAENLRDLGDVEGVKSDYLKVFGFDHEEIDYGQAVNIVI